MNRINSICLTVAIINIALGTVFGLSLVWIDVPSEFVWRCFLSLGILFGAAMLTGLAAGLLLENPAEKK